MGKSRGSLWLIEGENTKEEQAVDATICRLRQSHTLGTLKSSSNGIRVENFNRYCRGYPPVQTFYKFL